MKYFIDTEFIEYPNSIELISIGIKSEDGRKYYALSSEYDFKKADSWVVENVITPIYNDFVPEEIHNEIGIKSFHKYYGKSISRIRDEILQFVDFPHYRFGKPEFWGYYSDYDWVVFCWIFGKMIDLPTGFPMFCRDVQQVITENKIVNRIEQPENIHNALSDAIWTEKLYKDCVQQLNERK